ncbi:hypothetical protein [Kribbella speibonae]|nr:hypothetical protein [Kribbella speibonae]
MAEVGRDADAVLVVSGVAPDSRLAAATGLRDAEAQSWLTAQLTAR